MRILFSWVGFKDLNFFDSRLDDPDFHRRLEIAKETRPTVSKTSKYSPIFSVINNGLEDKRSFSKTVLFFDLGDDRLTEGIKKFLQRHCDEVRVVDVSVSASATHEYNGDLWKSAIAELDKIKAEFGGKVDPCFNLSSGTAAMKALLMLWGKTMYPESAEFAQVDDDGKVRVSPFNFDVGSYVVNETLKRVDLPEFDAIIGESPAIRKAKTLAAKAARTNFNILIYGESGTGKELLAHAVHKASERRDKPFRAVNCATLPPQLAESELFGYVKGAFTGANADRKGLFEELYGGTIFLDEIEACPPAVQAKLLRVLQPPEGGSITCRRFLPVGATQEKDSDVRIIAATNQRLENLEDSDFRKDLLGRLSALSISLPPLRERREDLRPLAESLLEQIKKQLGANYSNKKLCAAAIKFIEKGDWPGNVRELKNAITQAAVFGEGDTITAEDFELPQAPGNVGDTKLQQESGGAEEIDWSKPVDVKAILARHDLRLKKQYIDEALRQAGGAKGKAAELLGVPYQTIDNWQKKWETLFGNEKH